VCPCNVLQSLKSSQSLRVSRPFSLAYLATDICKSYKILYCLKLEINAPAVARKETVRPNKLNNLDLCFYSYDRFPVLDCASAHPSHWGNHFVILQRHRSRASLKPVLLSPERKPLNFKKIDIFIWKRLATIQNHKATLSYVHTVYRSPFPAP
jgi:hypothetical protein